MKDTIEYVIGADVRCPGQDGATVAFVVVDPVAKRLTHLAVQPGAAQEPARLVPVSIVELSPYGGIDLRCSGAEFDALEPAEETHFLHGTEGDWGYRSDQVLAWPFFGLARGGAGIILPEPQKVPELGPWSRLPPGEVGVRRGERVHAEDGEIGHVRGLVIDPSDGGVTHVLLDEGHLWGHKRVAIPIGAVTGINDEGVAVRMCKNEVRDLPPVDVEGLESGLESPMSEG
jgi:hypothetical protein